jgi:hypothetical protein
MGKAKRLALNFQTRSHPGRAFGLWLALLMLAACASDPPEAALRAQLRDMQLAASERRVGDFMQGVTDDFAGNNSTDRAALHNLMRLQMLGNSNVNIVSSPLDIQLRGEVATVKFSIVLTGGSGRWLPDSAQSYSINSGWRLEDGEWKVYYADWRPNL